MWKFLGQSLKWSILAVSVLFISLNANRLHESYLMDYIGNQVVMVRGEGGGGTGFHVEAPSGDVYILSNRHVCEVKDSSGRVKIITQDGKVHIKKVIKTYKKHDLCLIEPVRGYSGLELTDHQSLHSKTYIVGHPGLRPLTLSSGHYLGDETITMQLINIKKNDCYGIYEQLEENSLTRLFFGIESVCSVYYDTVMTDAPVYGGNSGSPMVDSLGNVWGVVFAKSMNAVHNGYIVPIDYVKDFLKKY
jgi:S1-C subfamily serine protease